MGSNRKSKEFKCPVCGHIQSSTAKTSITCKECKHRYHVGKNSLFTGKTRDETVKKKMFNFDGIMDFNEKKPPKKPESEEETQKKTDQLEKVKLMGQGLEMMSGDLSSYFGALAKNVIEGLTKPVDEIDWKVRGELIAETFKVCGGMFVVAPPDVENRTEISPLVLIGISAAAIAAPFIMKMFKDKKKKKEDEKNDKKNQQ